MRFLEREGYEPLPAATGEEGLRTWCSSDPPDLILLDLKLPGMDGSSVCRG